MKLKWDGGLEEVKKHLGYMRINIHIQLVNIIFVSPEFMLPLLYECRSDKFERKKNLSYKLNLHY